MSTGKKPYNLKAASYVLFWDLTEDSSPEGGLSGSSEELLQWSKGVAGIQEFLLGEKKM